MPKLTIEIKVDSELKQRLGIIPIKFEIEDDKDNDEYIKQLYLKVFKTISETPDKTSPVGEGNEPWKYNIPLNELTINTSQVEQPVFVYNGRVYQSQIRKAPLLRTHELDKNFSNLEDNSQIKKELEDFINNNYTHIYQVIEERMASFVGDNRVMNEVTYIIRGVKII